MKVEPPWMSLSKNPNSQRLFFKFLVRILSYKIQTFTFNCKVFQSFSCYECYHNIFTFHFIDTNLGKYITLRMAAFNEIGMGSLSEPAFLEINQDLVVNDQEISAETTTYYTWIIAVLGSVLLFLVLLMAVVMHSRKQSIYGRKSVGSNTLTNTKCSNNDESPYYKNSFVLNHPDSGVFKAPLGSQSMWRDTQWAKYTNEKLLPSEKRMLLLTSNTNESLTMPAGLLKSPENEYASIDDDRGSNGNGNKRESCKSLSTFGGFLPLLSKSPEPYATTDILTVNKQTLNSLSEVNRHSQQQIYQRVSTIRITITFHLFNGKEKKLCRFFSRKNVIKMFFRFSCQRRWLWITFKSCVP